MTEQYERKDKHFLIGDRIVVKEWDAICEERRVPHESTNDDPMLWSRAKAKICGKHGEIVDMVYSYKHKCDLYRIRLDESSKISSSMLPAEDLVAEDSGYEISFDIGEDSVTAIMKQGDRVVATGTAKLFGTTKLLMANGLSMAMRNLWERAREEEADKGNYFGRSF